MRSCDIINIPYTTLFVSIAWVLVASGCNRGEQAQSSDQKAIPSSEPASAAKGDTLAVMRQEIASAREGDVNWDAAWMLAKKVLIAYPEDKDALVEVAQVAYRAGHQDIAKDILVQAAVANNFLDESLVNRCVVAMIDAGDMFEAISFLERVVDAYPDRDKVRRLLCDLLIGAEYRERGFSHATKLIRQRKFDFTLLLAMDNHHRRKEENKSLDEMLKRNTDDRRASIGQARSMLDQSRFAEAGVIAKQILDRHPDFQPAMDIYGQALVASDQRDELEQWCVDRLVPLSQTQSLSWSGWITLGDWCRQKSDVALARFAYLNAVANSTDNPLAWSKLAEVSGDSEDIRHEANSLLKLRQQYIEFSKAQIGIGDVDTFLKLIPVIETLTEQGRLWQAEAWAALALTLPPSPSGIDEDAVALRMRIHQHRESILRRLNQNTPWRLASASPDTTISSDDLASSLAALAAKSQSDTARHVVSERNKFPFPDAPFTVDLRNEAVRRGVQFSGKTYEKLDQPGIPFYATLGCGGGAIDFDLDGWPDLYLATAGGRPGERQGAPNALLRNEEGTFRAVTVPTRTGDVGFGQGICVGDINSDGFADLFICNYGENRLLINCGDGTFADQTEQWLPSSDWNWSTSAAIADLDRDGLPDLYVTNYCAGTEPIDRRCDAGDRTEFNKFAGQARACSPTVFKGEPDWVFRGRGEGGLERVPAAYGFELDDAGRGLGVLVGELDENRGIDVFVANDMSLNHYWTSPPTSPSTSGITSTDHLKDDARIEKYLWLDASVSLGLAGNSQSTPQGSMGIASADLDRDGDLDFYVTNFMSESNTLHSKEATGGWRDETYGVNLTDVTLPMVGFGTECVDLNADGWREIIVTNGHVDLYSTRSEDAFYAQPLQVFQRISTGKFTNSEFEADGEYTSQHHVGRAMWTMDVNRDGRTDFAVTHQTEPVALLINHTPIENQTINVQLRGTQSGRDAIGASVTLSVGSHSEVQTLTTGSGFQCSNESVLMFVLPQSAEPNDTTLEVSWPSGRLQEFACGSDVRDWLLVEGDSDAFPITDAVR
ncbi:FG-GAP repeat protein [Rubripirellula amarantea]|uniref:FG-GAP repeat protein n=1 Tax=Rubripirellula amarantea TaxID=2527999 RepID=A0A5C5WSK9_9BACT|nr:FG-GAP-like repeat-containing protein [Rubripirellula amarantea]TWT52782.1 FG-GAP repeat protein [Rubripirellula amarantea]